MKASLEHIESMSASLTESGLPNTQAKAILAAVADSIDQFAMAPQKVEQRILQERKFYSPKFDDLRSDVTLLQAEVGVLKTDVALLKKDVAKLKTDVAALKADVSELKNDVAIIKTILNDHSQALKEISARLLHAERASFRYFVMMLLCMIGTMVGITANAMLS